MRIIVSGASGFIGSRLVQSLAASGDTVVRLVRSGAASCDAALWDPLNGVIDREALEGADAVVHLAGENIAQGRWTEMQKLRIRDSRVRATAVLSKTLAVLDHRPRVLVAASAVGYYGNRGDECLDETSSPGEGFLADVCRGWEGATAAAAGQGIRVVNLRFGMVLSGAGGALAKMLPPFKLGLGGVVGNGRQYVSWVAIDDAVGAIRHAMLTEDLHGPVNAVAPNPVTNRAFTKTLGKVLHRPTLVPVPAFGVRLLFGEMGEALLLSSQRVMPAKLLHSGYSFQYTDLEAAFRRVLGR